MRASAETENLSYSIRRRDKFQVRRGGRRLPYSRTSGEQNLRKKTGKKRLTSGRLYGNINIALRNSAVQPLARVVELVDSLASGASARKGVRVRLPPRAPNPCNPNLFPIGDGFGLLLFFDRYETPTSARGEAKAHLQSERPTEEESAPMLRGNLRRVGNWEIKS